MNEEQDPFYTGLPNVYTGPEGPCKFLDGKQYRNL